VAGFVPKNGKSFLHALFRRALPDFAKEKAASIGGRRTPSPFFAISADFRP
jgi:hypothetical protein